MSNADESVTIDPKYLHRAEKALEARARRAAYRNELIARKSRWRANSYDNQGGFTLVDFNNHCVAGAQYEMSAEDVIEYCAG